MPDRVSQPQSASLTTGRSPHNHNRCLHVGFRLLQDLDQLLPQANLKVPNPGVLLPENQKFKFYTICTTKSDRRQMRQGRHVEIPVNIAAGKESVDVAMLTQRQAIAT